MKRSRISVVAVLLMLSLTLSLIFILTACGTQNPLDTVANELGIDVSAGEVISFVDNHGGFHGDGTACIVVQFTDNSLEKQLAADTNWKPLPPDETTTILVYGISTDEYSAGPYLKDSAGSTLVPRIQNGYYRLIDRQAQSDEDILERASLNFTFGIYDSNNGVLYYCKMDT